MQVANFSPADILAKLSGQREDGTLCDVELKVEGVRLLAHRALLAAVSPYFQALLFNDFKERSQKVIEIKGINYDSLKTILHCCYSGELELTTESLPGILAAADLLQVKEVISLRYFGLYKRRPSYLYELSDVIMSYSTPEGGDPD